MDGYGKTVARVNSRFTLCESLLNPQDFVKLAESFGIKGLRVKKQKI